MTEGTANKINNGMIEALLSGNAEALRDLMRCPLTRAEALINAFNHLMLKDSSIVHREKRDDKGYRKGVFKPKWIHTPTKTVRVPLLYMRDIVAFAHGLDKGKINPADVLLDEEDYDNASPQRIK